MTRGRKISQSRYRTRKKRSQNRLRIGVILIGIFLAIAVISYFILKTLIMVAGFILLVGLVYGFAGWWEKKELEKKEIED